MKGGLAVFVTNDDLYTKEENSDSDKYLFCMNNGAHGTKKHWQNLQSTCAKTHPNFDVEKEYSISWHQKDVDGVDFHYCIVEI